MANAPSPFFLGAALARQTEGHVNWDRIILIAILSASGGGQILGGVGQGKVAEQLAEVKTTLVEAVTELKEQRREYERFKQETNLRLNELELTLRTSSFPSRQKP
jgi:hypothetical protein